ncbi:hypothetical protein EVG20_g7782, partial [Dentipellis fragilis]
MLPFNAQTGSRAPHNAQHVGPAHVRRPEDTSSGAAGQSRQSQRRRVRSELRCQMLLLEREAIKAESRDIIQRYGDRLIDLYELQVLDADCQARRRAVTQALEEEWQAEP